MPAKNDKHTINLGLQGGGAHGAFTWGVLDYLLEDGRLQFEGVSGTSAGAMNATILAYGMLQNGPEGARAALRAFWSAVATSMPFEMITQSAADEAAALLPGVKVMLQWARYFSPEQINPFDVNPLRDILSEQVDFERLRQDSPLKLYIAATHARSGKLRLFRRPQISIDAVLASACLPTIHHTIEIDGEPYWDGAFSANPAIFPLLLECAADDVLLVLLAPREHQDMPRNMDAIRARTRELAFNATFLREMRVFATLQQHYQGAEPPKGKFEKNIIKTRFHIIEPHEAFNLKPETKMAVGQRFFETLFEQGRLQAQAWLKQHYKQVGRQSTVDLVDLFC